jgi:hypothetical protein
MFKVTHVDIIDEWAAVGRLLCAGRFLLLPRALRWRVYARSVIETTRLFFLIWVAFFCFAVFLFLSVFVFV